MNKQAKLRAMISEKGELCILFPIKNGLGRWNYFEKVSYFKAACEDLA
jgi:hypothetical protein